MLHKAGVDIMGTEGYVQPTVCSVFLKKYFIHLFLERGEGREGERERNINVREIHESLASHMPPTGNLAHNPGMCPDWE